jgi:hypothetical protein
MQVGYRYLDTILWNSSMVEAFFLDILMLTFGKLMIDLLSVASGIYRGTDSVSPSVEVCQLVQIESEDTVTVDFSGVSRTGRITSL